MERLIHSIRSTGIDNSARGKHGSRLVEDDILGEAFAEFVRADENVLGILNFTEEVLLHQILLVCVEGEKVLVY